jgi:hypothetical protein
MLIASIVLVSDEALPLESDNVQRVTAPLQLLSKSPSHDQCFSKGVERIIKEWMFRM